MTAEALDVLRSWAVQDSPPGAAVAALVARCPDVPVGWLDAALYEERTVVALYNPRTATAIVPADEVAAFGTAFLPPDDAALKAIVGLRAARRSTRASRSRSQLAVDAISDALDGVELQPRRPARGSCASGCPASCCRGARAARATTRGAGCW